MSAYIAYRVLFVIPSALPVIPSEVEESPVRLWGAGVAYSSSGTTTITNVRIGDDVLEDVVPGSKEHICGDAYPMYGAIKGLSKETSPYIEMHHLAALVAIKVINATAGTIKIDDVEFGMPKIVSKDPITQKKTITEATNILGDCTISLSGETPSTTVNGTNVYPVTKACLDKTYELESGKDMIVYMAVSPVKTNGKTISIKVNGSQRTLKMTKNVLNPGKVTTFKVEVKPFVNNKTDNLVSNAFDDEFKSSGEQGYVWEEERYTVSSGMIPDYAYRYSQGAADPQNTHAEVKMVSLGNSSEIKNATINGQTCNVAYKLGTTSAPGTITIQGWAKDLLDALPLSFYVSAADNSPAAMTIHSVDLWIPEYNKAKQQHNKYDPFPSTKTEYHRLTTRTQLKNSTIGSLIGILNKAEQFKDLKVTENGLERESLVAFVDPNTITFNGIPTNGYFSNNNIVVLREDVTHKSITPDLIDSFLGKKFSLDPVNSPASFLGLVAMVNATKNNETGALKYNSYTSLDGNTYDATTMQAQAEQTANAIYNKIVSVLNNRIPSSISGLISGENVINVIFESPTDLIHKVRDMKFKLVIQTYPYADTYPTTSTTYSPVILWEMNGTK